MNILPKSPSAKVLLLAGASFVAIYATYSVGQTTPPNIAPIQLSADPLYAQGTGQKPTLTLALSVEFPTVGAQYRETGYNPAKEFIGYFDLNSCYSYSNASSEDERRFERIGAATARKCSGTGFSGNFLNFATSSSIDILRYGLTGGDRIIDTANLTVLQRAVLKRDGPSFWNNGYFPQKNVSNAAIVGAVPTTLLGKHTGNVYVSNCLNRIFFSNSASNGSCESPDFEKALGSKKGTQGPASGSSALSTDLFFARVKVCESSGSTLLDPRPDLCQRYPNGNYKPVGNMQKYSDRIRLSAFGYLLENGNARYGGVLRAPMSFVGPKTYDQDGNAIAGLNPHREWNPDSGVFLANPQQDSEFGISGVANYLNQFGRSGVYKSNDPVGELYYESLRYLQGLGPTPEAVSNLTAAGKDGFPVYASWVDPFGSGSKDKSYACLRNSILLIGDVNTHNDKSFPGNSRIGNSDFARSSDISANIPDFKFWTKVVGGFESGTAVSYTDGDGVARSTSNPTSVKFTDQANIDTRDTGASGAAFYIAGASYWAHTHDIRGSQWTASESKQRPGLRVSTYVLDVNENSAQSNSATARHKSQFFLTAKYGGFNDVSRTGNPFLPANDDGTFDSRHWEKETEPGEAKTYFLASDAKAVLKGLDDIFVAATKISNTISSPAPSSNRLSTSDGYLYLASFDPEFWSGDIKRTSIKVTAAGAVEQGAANTAISAAKKLDAVSNTDSRKIFVGKSTNTASGYASEFTWASIETALKDALNKETPTAVPDANGEKRLNFIRGNRSDEGSLFRVRASRFGDIVNSGAAYSAAPTTRYNFSGYKTFYDASKGRTKAVFVGANDGMLHAFNADTMDELFAYIPSWLGGKLSVLTAADYNSSRHTSYVDATPVVAEAKLGADWKTVLVSGTGGGGQGVFALDVTDPSAFSAANVLWEFTDTDDAAMGNVVGEPKILRVRTSKLGEPLAFKWFAVVASGVNNYVDDGADRTSTSGEPALFLLSLDKPTSENWSLGTNYFKISLPTSNDVALGTQVLNTDGTASGVGKATGLLRFDATGDESDAVRFVYMGDLHGQFWKIDLQRADFSSATAASWDLNKTSAFKNSADKAVPFYIAKDTTGKVQPISMTPTLAYGPNLSFIVAFGTGKYLEAADNAITAATQVQSFYVLYDNEGNGPPTDPAVTALADSETSRFKGRVNLQKGTASGANISIANFLWTDAKATANGTAPAPNKKAGWFLDFPLGGAAGGERQVTSAALLGKKIIFNSLMPPSASTDVCGGGSSYTYSANLASGLGSVSAVSVGAQGAPIIFSVGSKVTSSGSTGLRTMTERFVHATPSATGDDKLNISDAQSVDSIVGRLNWRRIDNYREMLP